MRTCLLHIFLCVLQTYASTLSTLLCAWEAGLCDHINRTPSWVWPLRSTSRRLAMVEWPWARGCLHLWTRSQIPPAVLPVPFPASSPSLGPFRSRGTDGALPPPALEYCTSPVASLHPVHPTKSTPVIMQVSWMILIKVCHLFHDEIPADTTWSIFGWRKNNWVIEKVLVATCASFYF